MHDKERADHYEKLLRQILQPLNEIPFDLFIKAISGRQIVAIDDSTKEDKALLNELRLVLKQAMTEIKKNRNPYKASKRNRQQSRTVLEGCLREQLVEGSTLISEGGLP